MAMSGGADDGAPMMDMNMTPLIDVLLVLLVMMIITIPVATHSVDIDLPTPSTVPTDNVEPDKNKIVLTPSNEILWNGLAINQNQLVANLQATRALATEPELQFEPDSEAGYDLTSKVLNIIKGSGVTKFGFVGNEKYRAFSK
jgi:biopolymer transport protein ExbD